MTTNSVFADRLTKVREERGIKRQQAANDIGITRASLEYYEKGQRKPDTEILMKLCDYYKVSADYLLGISNAQITATEDEQLKTVCDYLEIDELSLAILKSQIHDDRFSVLLRNKALLLLPSLFDDYHNKLIEAINELQIAYTAATNKENEKAKGHIINYLIINELLSSTEIKIQRVADSIYYRENALLLDKLNKLKVKDQIEEIINSTSISDIYEKIKYKGE